MGSVYCPIIFIFLGRIEHDSKKQGYKQRYDFVVNDKRYRKIGFTRNIDVNMALNDA